MVKPVTPQPDSSYERAVERMARIALVLAVVATLVVWVRFDWRYALGFGTGAAVSTFNLSWWKRMVGAIGAADGTARPASAVFLGLRYLILGGICFVIIKYLAISYLALIAGLLTAVAAVLAEMVYELVFTR